MSTLIAERRLDHSGIGNAGSVRVYAPFDEGQSWRCNYEIEWPGHAHKWKAVGEDSYQALQLAMQMVPVEISVTDDFKAGRLGCFGAPLLTNDDLIQWLGLRPMQVLQ